MGVISASLAYLILLNVSVHCLSIKSAEGSLGIYLHIPFCRKRCFYCDFPISAVGESKTAQQKASESYIELLKKEIRSYRSLLGVTNVTVDSVYFGGGTPSLLTDSCIYSLMEVLHRTFDVSSSAEVTFEADPGTFRLNRLRSWYSFGINRLSIGVQSFDDEVLKAAGRAHCLKDVTEALIDIHKSDFQTFSIDLISSLPHSTHTTWMETLEQAVNSQPTHISVYDLQVEEKTAFGRWYTPGQFPLPSEEDSTLMYTTAVEKLTQSGFEHYEVSNYAKPGHRSQHNQKYWQCAPTLAFGLGAASYVNGCRFTRPSSMVGYQQWISKVTTDPSLLFEEVTASKLLPGSNAQILTHAVVPDLLEYVMLALRTKDGLDLRRLEERYGREIFLKVVRVIECFVEEKKIIWDNHNVRLSDPHGFIISNAIISEIFGELER